MEMSEQILNATGTNDAKREVAVSYNRIAGIYEQLGGKDNLKKALELYQKCLDIKEQLAESESTIDAYDDLAVSLYKVAMHEYTDPKTKKQLLTRGLQVAKMLYDNLPNERYETLVRDFERELKKMSE